MEHVLRGKPTFDVRSGQDQRLNLLQLPEEDDVPQDLRVSEDEGAQASKGTQGAYVAADYASRFARVQHLAGNRSAQIVSPSKF